MPAAAPRPCTAPGCRRLLPIGQQCPDHPRNWSKQDKRRGSRHKRGYGNEWVKVRDQVMLRDKGLCQPCVSQARYTPATEVDHIIAKANGGTDAPANLQAICRQCHISKTAQESQGLHADPMPEWLPTPRIPVIVIAGPPGAGKLEHARKLAGPNDLVLDLDEIAARQHGTTPPLAKNLERTARNTALRERNALLALLGKDKCNYARAILTVTAGTAQAREWWRTKLNAQLITLTPPRHECEARIRALRLNPVRELELVKAIHAWR